MPKFMSTPFELLVPSPRFFAKARSQSEINDSSRPGAISMPLVDSPFIELDVMTTGVKTPLIKAVNAVA